MWVRSAEAGAGNGQAGNGECGEVDDAGETAAAAAETVAETAVGIVETAGTSE